MTALSGTLLDIIDRRIDAALDRRAMRLQWGTVTSANLVLLDGDTAPLPASTPTLVPLVAGARVAVDRNGTALRIIGALPVGGAVTAGPLQVAALSHVACSTLLDVPSGPNTLVPGLTTTVRNPKPTNALVRIDFTADCQAISDGFDTGVLNVYEDGSATSPNTQIIFRAGAGARLTLANTLVKQITPGNHTFSIWAGKTVGGGTFRIWNIHSTLTVTVYA